MARTSKIKFELSPKAKRYVRLVQSVLSKAEFYRILVKFFDRFSQITAGQIVKTQLSGDPLRRRTGALAASIIGRGEIIDGVPGFRIGSLRGPATRYAAVQELGTKGAGGELPTIVPRNAKALAMPVNRTLTPAGVARWAGPRDAPIDLRFVPFRRGIAVGGLYNEVELKALHGASLSTIQPYYILLSKADIKPKRFLRNGIQAALPKLGAELAKLLKDLVEGRVPRYAQ